MGSVSADAGATLLMACIWRRASRNEYTGLYTEHVDHAWRYPARKQVANAKDMKDQVKGLDSDEEEWHQACASHAYAYEGICERNARAKKEILSNATHASARLPSMQCKTVQGGWTDRFESRRIQQLSNVWDPLQELDDRGKKTSKKQDEAIRLQDHSDYRPSNNDQQHTAQEEGASLQPFRCVQLGKQPNIDESSSCSVLVLFYPQHSSIEP